MENNKNRSSAVCITGMHRSGTSMVARLLNLCGLFLGELRDLIPPSKENPEGYWENIHFVSLNEQLLIRQNGGWDFPPELSSGWQRSQDLFGIKNIASGLIKKFALEPYWGWKDPRSCLTMDFWKSLIDDLKVVICVRDPREVAQSLRKRGVSSAAFSFNLWMKYNQAVLQSSDSEKRIITHYESYFSNPKAELARVADFLGLPVQEDGIEKAAATIRSALWRNRAPKVEMPPNVASLYGSLCQNAGAVFDGADKGKISSIQKEEPLQPPVIPAEGSSPQTEVRTDAEKDLVSIIILTCNQIKYTKRCVESIREHTPEAHEIIFIDNGSTDGTTQWLGKQAKNNPHYKLIKNKKNFGFSKGCNQGIQASSGEYILLLNNDVVVTEDWLAGMLEVLNSAAGIGIVGPMTNSISGPQKVPIVDYTSIKTMADYARSFRRKNRHRWLPQRRIVGFCMLFKRQFVEDIGLLDESFGSGNFEDDDLCLRASLAGYRNLIAGDVFIHHYGSRTFIGNKIDYGSSLTGNRKVFLEKWRGKDVVQRFGKKLLIENALVRAGDFHDQGIIEKAAGSMLDAIKQLPDDKSLYLHLAEMLIDAKRYEDACGLLESMPQRDADARQLGLLGYCEEALGRDGKAQDHIDRALDIDPNNISALNTKGLLAYKQGGKDLAESLFRKAIDLGPSHGESYTNLGSLKWESGERAEGLELFERGFILAPTANDVATAYYSAVADTGEFQRAEPSFREAQALFSNNKRISFLLISLLIQMEKYDAAISEIEKAMMRFGIDDGILSAAQKIRARIGPMEIRPGSSGRSLSVCMIVKNEESNLAKCLMSAKPVADEIIVVDTGSTDKTKAIASALGAKVFDFPWTDNFSEARNHSLSKASGDWILVLDADEVISQQDHAGLRSLIQASDKRFAYSMVTRNYTNQTAAQNWTANDGKYLQEEVGSGWLPSPKVRLFANDQRIRFANAVHELVEPTLRDIGIWIKHCGIPVHHYGRLDQDRTAAKGQEYYRLGKKKVLETKGDYKAMKELAIQASEIGKYAEAVSLWEKLLELNPQDAAAHLNLGYAHIKLSQYDQGLIYSRKAWELEPGSKEAGLNYAGCELIVGDVERALCVLNKVLKTCPDYPPALARLAAACIVNGQREEGLECLERLRRLRYDCAEVFSKHARAFLSHNRFEQAIALLETGIETNQMNADAHSLLAECRRKRESHMLAEAIGSQGVAA